MADWRGHAWIALPLRLLLGGVFLAACWYKIAHPDEFALSIATYGIVPLWLINIFAVVLPWVELATGLLIVLGLRTRAAALLVSAMLLMFSVALVIALAKGLDTGCGCFASAQAGETITPLTVVRDAALLLPALYVLAFDRRPLGLDRIWSK
ncbi:MAG: MauE/DoxX family redox-associated membrane protein [Candidatus Alcyoniella australis]|nr:MauE/DoxX family redox-associated membrane protein [Candidatus Alcyoniella australis]